MHKTFRRGAVAALLLGAFGAQAWTHDFDDGAQGWTTVAGGAPTWRASGGNGAGFLEVADITDEDFLLVAPAAVLGNWSAMLGGKLFFEARNINGEAPDWAPFGEVTLSNGLTSVVLDIAAANQPAVNAGWTRYAVDLTPALWGAGLASVLGNVTSFTIKGEYHAGVSEIVGVDNIGVTAAVPEPGTWALMLGGIAGIAALKRRQRR